MIERIKHIFYHRFVNRLRMMNAYSVYFRRETPDDIQIQVNYNHIKIVSIKDIELSRVGNNVITIRFKR